MPNSHDELDDGQAAEPQLLNSRSVAESNFRICYNDRQKNDGLDGRPEAQIFSQIAVDLLLSKRRRVVSIGNWVITHVELSSRLAAAQAVVNPASIFTPVTVDS